MGGDFAPEAAVVGAVMACREIDAQDRIVLFGEAASIRDLLEKNGCDCANIEVVPTTGVIGMDEHPAHAFSKKPDSSIAVGFGWLKAKKIDAFASAGSTGAMMVGSMHVIGQIPGVIRPTITSPIPTVDGGQAIVLDVGLNVDCKPDVLAQYGQLGSIYAQTVLGIDNPRVALLNIGEEKEKGNLAARAAYEQMEGTTDFNFVGNVEAKHMFDGTVADVIVCDGFTGNCALKQAEGFYDICQKLGIQNRFIDGLNYEQIGGTPVLGINSNVIIGHGCSTPLAIKNMILQGLQAARTGFVEVLRKSFDK